MVATPPYIDGQPANHFNLVRLLLSLAVLFSHCFELIDRGRTGESLYRLTGTFTAGDLAVDGFFVLSGFLILQSWRRDPHATRYLARRVLRIYPAFLVTTLLCGLVLGPAFGGGVSHYFEQFHTGAFAVAALGLREPAVPPVFIGSPYTDVNGSMWTIQYEFICYVLVVAGGLATRHARIFWWAVFCGALTLAVFGGNMLGGIHFFGSRVLLGDEPHEFMRFLVFFAAGALWCLHVPRVRPNAAVATLAVVATIVSLPHPAAAQFVLPTAGAYLLLALASLPATDSPLQRFVRRNDLSYGIYLVGWPVQQLWIHWLHIQSPWVLLSIAVPSAAACAAVSWYWIERPALRWKPLTRTGTARLPP